MTYHVGSGKPEEEEEVKEEKRELSALDAYLNRVYKFLILVPTSVAASSAITYTIFYIIDWYDLSFVGLVLFDLANLAYFLLAMFFYVVGNAGDGEIKRQKLEKHKVAVGVIALIQFTSTEFLIPYPHWWVFAPFFIFFTVFFFDIKLTS